MQLRTLLKMLLSSCHAKHPRTLPAHPELIIHPELIEAYEMRLSDNDDDRGPHQPDVHMATLELQKTVDLVATIGRTTV